HRHAAGQQQPRCSHHDPGHLPSESPYSNSGSGPTLAGGFRCSVVVCVARVVMLTLAVVVIEARTSTADEIWVVPTFQQDTGGGRTAAGVLWPVTKAGA